jgi:acyl carrier protein
VTQDEVLQKLKEILEGDFRVPPSKVTREATFRGTFGMDSLDAVDFIYLVSKTFGLKADVSQFRELHSVGTVVDFLRAEVLRREASKA